MKELQSKHIRRIFGIEQEQGNGVNEELFENNLMFQSTMVKESEQKSPNHDSG